MGNDNFRPPTELTPLNRSPKNLSWVILSATPTAVRNLVHIPPRGLLGESVKYDHNLFIYLYHFWELTYKSDRSADFPALWLKQHGQKASMCLFQFRWYSSPFRGQIPQNLNFGGMNRHFQAKLAKLKTCILSKLLH